MLKVFKACVVFIIIFSLIGCSTFKPAKQQLNIITSESDAEIFVNGNLIGKGNVTTEVPTNKSVTIMAKKDGYIPATTNIGTKLSRSGVLDIVGTFCFLFPGIGLFSAGAYELQNDRVSLPLAKQSK